MRADGPGLANIDFVFEIGISGAVSAEPSHLVATYWSRNPGPRVQLELVRIWVMNTGFTANSVDEIRISVSAGSYGQLMEIDSLQAFLKASYLSWYCASRQSLSRDLGLLE